MAEAVFHAALPVIGPAQHGGEGEKDDAEHQDHRPQIGNLIKGQGGQGAAVSCSRHIDLRIFQDAGHKHQPGHGADHNRIPEGSGGGYQSLSHRISGLSCRRRDGRASHTGFIGKQAACHAVVQGQHQPAAHQTARRRAGAERHGHDGLQGRNEKIMVDAKNNKTADAVKKRHKGNQLLADLRDGLDPAEDDRRRKRRYDQTDRPYRDTQIRFAHRRDGVHLGGAADSEGRKGRQKREHQPQPLHMQSSFQRVHGSALHPAVLCFHPVLHGDQGLRIFGGDSEHARQPAPEHRARAAQHNGRSHSNNISRSDGRGQRRHQRAELTHLSLRVRIRREGKPDGRSQLFLNPARTDGHHQMRSEKQKDHGPAPYRFIHRVDQVYCCFRYLLHIYLPAEVFYTEAAGRNHAGDFSSAISPFFIRIFTSLYKS